MTERTVPYCTGTIKHIHNILNPAMRQAVKEGLVAKNIMLDVSPPRVVKTRETRSLNKEEVSKYLDVLKGHRLYAAFLLELTTGLRRGELLGLQWNDLDMETGALKIRRQINRIKQEDGKTSLEYCPLKTPASYRTIVLPVITLQELKSHKARQAQEKLLAGDSYKKEDLIFCNALGEKLDTRYLYRVHCKALESAQIEHTAFHNLRHTVATLLLQAGQNIKTIQDLLGHADIETTLNDYSHVLDEMKKAQADKLDLIFKDVLPETPSNNQSDSMPASHSIS
jgi:integrase